jgi:Fe-S-cluster-containing hydrogenase component 2
VVPRGTIAIRIDHDRCRKCYRCVRVCPTNALKIDHEQVREISERCVLCGTCYKLCAHGAVHFQDEIARVVELLEAPQAVVACLDPTFPAVLDRGSPGQLVAALKKLGFSEVWESAFGGELVTRACRDWLATHRQGPNISSFCPALTRYVEKFAPSLVYHLIPIVSPMVATARVVRELRGPQTRIVFIGSCLARIGECEDPAVGDLVDGVLTYNDILQILRERGIERVAQVPEEFDGPRPHRAALLAIAGGMSECCGYEGSLLNQDYVVRARADRVLRAIRQLSEGLIHAQFMDLLLCDGCIHGPIVDSSIPIPSRREKLVGYIKSCLTPDIEERTCAEVARFAHLDLTRTFRAQRVVLDEPREEEIQRVLVQLGKTYPEHNLDCGSCGYPTCRLKAVAVAQGVAEPEMCPHFLLERCRGFYVRLEKAHTQLKNSHEELRQAQTQLIQTEKLASLGQMAAGVAHELNNPLGTITMLAGMLRREAAANERWSADIDLVVQEAERAAKIVRDLLSFSRKTDVRPGPTDINALLEQTLELLLKQSLFHNIEVERKLNLELPKTFADPDLLKQVFLNIILNGAQAMNGQGRLTVATHCENDSKGIGIQITDTGCGIPREYMNRLFEPFFTTKEKGTGLGLAIVYGIVSRHRGEVEVESEVGSGTTFAIHLPVMDSRMWMVGEEPAGGRAPAGGDVGRQGQDLIG